MGNKPPPPPQPPKTVKEMVKEFSRTIRKLQRDFNREIMRMEMQSKKLKTDLEKAIKAKEPKATQRMFAANLLRNQQYIQKYQRLDAQMNDVMFQLNSAATTETLVQVMTGMSKMMKQANSAIDVKNVQQAIEMFSIESEKQNFLQEQIGEIMNEEADEYNDENADKYIQEVESKLAGAGTGGGGQKMMNMNQPIQQQQQPQQQQNPQENLDDLDAKLKAL
ncbi:unnamed protein product [Paramecium sonneborni]|uniref:Uncharacterized protein n=1 Tax=Paramecium sonneborni TaxID=65129 RepID=A0A8S1L0Y1_9CILI|nr:unnamed protein product [Paramecium sonneborni]